MIPGGQTSLVPAVTLPGGVELTLRRFNPWWANEPARVLPASAPSIALGPPFLGDNGLNALTRVEFWRELAEHGRSVALSRDEVFAHFSRRGGYPLGHARPDVRWEQLADQLNENVIRRVIQHDLRLGERAESATPP